MARIRLYANKATFKDFGGHRIMSVSIDIGGSQQGPLGRREEVEVRTADDVERAVKTFGDQIAAEYAGSFSVGQMLLKGSRAPSGYRQRKFDYNVDRCPRAVPAEQRAAA